jgi:glycosyltransferase involved in cell wall biosynthesis
MNRFSVCLITLNEEQNLPRALDSVQGVADEIVVLDCGSTDRTQQIAREHSAAVFERAWTSYGEQRNFAVACAKNEWIFTLDADEALSPELRGSLFEWKEQDLKFSVYEMPRRAWYLERWIKHSGWYPDYQPRLYRRDAAKYSGIIHESLLFDGPRGRLNGDLLHFTFQSFAEHEQKVESYAALAAQQMFLAGKRSWRLAMWLAAPWSWFQNYFLRGGFLDGYRGALIAQMAARMVRRKYRELGKLVANAAKQDRR